MSLIAFSLPLNSLAAETTDSGRMQAGGASPAPTSASSIADKATANPAGASQFPKAAGGLAPAPTGAANMDVVKGVGLKPDELHLVNQGRFTELAQLLSTRLSSESGTGRESAWLAFAYLYLQKCQDLKQMAGSPIANSNSQINSTLITAFSLLCDKKLDMADVLLQKAVPASAMNDAFVNYAFATLYGKKGMPKQAITYIKRSVELAPDFAWGYRTIGFLQANWLKQNKEAEISYTKALNIEPKLSEASVALINLYIAENNYDQAIETAKTTIKHDGHNSGNYYQLADIYIRQWRLNEAAQQLRKAIAIEPANNQYRRVLAAILHKQGKMDEAIAEEKIVVNYSNNKAVDLVDLAEMQIAAGKQDAAAESLNEALDIDPENMPAANVLTDLLVQMGHIDQLIAELNKCAAKAPKNEVLRLRIGDALAAAKQTDKAIEAYKEAANLNPNDAEPHTRIAAIYVNKKILRMPPKNILIL